MRLYSVKDEEFKAYGEVIDGDFSEIIEVAEKLGMPEEGSRYIASVDEFEKLSVKELFKNEIFGEAEIQMGYCFGHSKRLNAFEWHKSSEVNIGVTDAILFLGTLSEMEDGKYDTKNAKAFLLRRGEAIEVYSTTLHFCPCETRDSGFGMVVILPEGTNTDLLGRPSDRRIFRKNKWIIAHEDNAELIARGVVPGVFGKNFEIGKDL